MATTNRIKNSIKSELAYATDVEIIGSPTKARFVSVAIGVAKSLLLTAPLGAALGAGGLVAMDIAMEFTQAALSSLDAHHPEAAKHALLAGVGLAAIGVTAIGGGAAIITKGVADGIVNPVKALFSPRETTDDSYSPR